MKEYAVRMERNMGKVTVRGAKAREEAVGIVRAGGSWEEAAEKTGYGRDYVRQLCKEAGVVSAHDMRQSDETETQRCVQLALRGYAVKEIAPMMRRSDFWVRKVLKEANVTPTKKYELKKPRAMTERQKAVIEMRSCGLGYGQIAKELGITKSTAYQTCKALGLSGRLDQYAEQSKQKMVNPADYVARYRPELEWISGDGTSGEMTVRFKTCGHVSERSAALIRQTCTEIICRECQKEKRAERKRQEERQRAEKKEKKQLAMVEKARREELEKEKIKAAERAIDKVCPHCGKVFHSDDKRRKYCSDACRFASKDKYRDLFPIEEVYERDHGICYLCGDACDWNDYEVKDGVIVYGNNYPSRDHVVPRSKGGTNTWNNIRLAHRHCNSAKQNKLVAGL